MFCYHPFRIKKNLSKSEYPNGLLVACGKCVGCRIQKRKEITIRLINEFDFWEDGIFITLTYDDKILEKKNKKLKLNKRDVQLFIKRLRKNTNLEIKYLMVGEHGEKTYRPHYHGIIFGITEEYKKIIESTWNYGNIHIGTITPSSIRYVAKYMDKVDTQKRTTKEREIQKIITSIIGEQKPFRLISGGMGKRFALKYKDQILDQGYINYKGIKHSIPRYYINLYENDPRIEKIKEEAIKQQRKENLDIIGMEITEEEIESYCTEEEKAFIKREQKTRREYLKRRLINRTNKLTKKRE